MPEDMLFMFKELMNLNFIGAGGVSLLLRLSFSLILGLLMMWVYRACQNSLSYNKQFNVTLMMMTLGSTILLSLLQNNPLFSLGTLGALSICRIRINTRDPRNLGFVFWALTIGISSALEAFVVGALGSAVLTLVILLLNCYGEAKPGTTLIIRGAREKLSTVVAMLSQSGKNILLSQNIFAEDFELVYTLKIPSQEQEHLLVALNELEGVDSVNILAPETRVD